MSAKLMVIFPFIFKVLDLPTYETRQRDYASRGQKHFYFMTLNGGEVWPAPFTFDYTVAEFSVHYEFSMLS